MIAGGGSSRHRSGGYASCVWRVSPDARLRQQTTEEKKSRMTMIVSAGVLSAALPLSGNAGETITGRTSSPTRALSRWE
jgi:hypothetical protein